MRVATIFTYLIGRRQAILEIATEPGALAVGGLLVFSVALARNYDRVSLLHEPWRLLGPFVASLAISGALFLFVYGVARWKGMENLDVNRAYFSFLALYWMTAPLGWPYAIPYERFLSPLEAVKANLWTLALVSIWRVALMTRVVSVVFGLRVRAALPLVMLVADAAALAALYLVPLPVIHVMGGISPEQDALAWAAMLVTVLCWLTLPFWIGFASAEVYIGHNKPAWQVAATSERAGLGTGALTFAGLTVVAWAVVLPFTQREQIVAHRIERAYRTSGPLAALTMMSEHNRIEFPPNWQPPPRKFPGEPSIDELLNMLEALVERPHPAWIDQAYSRRFRDRVIQDEYAWPEERLSRYAVRLAAILPRLPEGPLMAKALQHPIPSIELVLDADGMEPRPALTEDQRAALKTLLRLTGDVEKKGISPISLDESSTSP
jgi:hypothetical protein